MTEPRIRTDRLEGENRRSKDASHLERRRGFFPPMRFSMAVRIRDGMQPKFLRHRFGWADEARGRGRGRRLLFFSGLDRLQGDENSITWLRPMVKVPVSVMDQVGVRTGKRKEVGLDQRDDEASRVSVTHPCQTTRDQRRY